MNTVVSTTLISVLGAGLIEMLFHYLRDLSTRFSNLELAVKNLGSDVGALDTKFTGELKDLESRLTDKFLGQLREHGEHLARIEAKLDIDPPAEAA